MTEIAFSNIQISTKPFSPALLNKGLFIVILHAKRIPPHIGFICNGVYHSLTIKGSEPNIPAETLLKAITQSKIETLFFKIIPHPVFSLDYLNDVIVHVIENSLPVNTKANTCLTPLKTFFNEQYALNSLPEEIISDFIDRMNNNNFILEAYSLNLAIQENTIQLPLYSTEELNAKIEHIRNEFYTN